MSLKRSAALAIVIAAVLAAISMSLLHVGEGDV